MHHYLNAYNALVLPFPVCKANVDKVLEVMPQEGSLFFHEIFARLKERYNFNLYPTLICLGQAIKSNQITYDCGLYSLAQGVEHI